MEHSAHLTADHKNVLQELRSAALLDPARLAEVAEEAEPDAVKRQTLLQQISPHECFAARAICHERQHRSAPRLDPRFQQSRPARRPAIAPADRSGSGRSYASMANLTDEILRLIARTAISGKTTLSSAT